MKVLVGGAVCALVLVTAACGALSKDNDALDSLKSAAASARADASKAPASPPSGGDSSDPICADAGTPETQALFFGLQMLAQPSLSTLVEVHDGTSPVQSAYDFDAIDAGIAQLHVLDGRTAPGFKDPANVLATWQDLSDKMRAIVEADAEPTQADVDAYSEALGDPSALIMSQVDVSMAQEQYCKG